MATIAEIIEAAQRLCGIRDTTDTTRLNEGLKAFNIMLTSWEEILQYAPVEESAHTLTVGTQSYTIGTGGDIDTARPTNIVSAFIRDSSGNDYSLNIISVKKNMMR